jgi:hypothetical protein
MPADPSPRFQSVLSALMEKFLQEKHACGYAYQEATRILRHLDSFWRRKDWRRMNYPAPLPGNG